MKVKVETDIFDDPDFCGNDNEICSEMYRDNWEFNCHIFKSERSYRIRLKVKMVKFSWGNKQIPIKCHECKEIYKQHKNK